MEEPSVLDYVIDRLKNWRERSVPASLRAVDETSPEGENEKFSEGYEVEPELTLEEQSQLPEGQKTSWPWRSLAALGFALLAQSALEPPNQIAVQGVIFYGLALVCLIWAVWRGEWKIPSHEEFQVGQPDPLTVRTRELLIGSVLVVLAFASFGGNQFNTINLTLWMLSLFFIVKAFWLPGRGLLSWLKQFWIYISSARWQVVVTRWSIVVLAVFCLAAFYRFYQLNTVPPEMVSDHAEKLWDVYDVMHGDPRLFFPRNTGREFFQMYLTAGVISILNTGYSFLSLKIGTALLGLLTLPFIYLLGKEVANRRVGLLAMLFAGIAYWPNVISRIALRFTLYPFFTAPAFYFLVRGLKRRNRNDFIISGIFLGLGLHGYSTMRIVPIFLVVAVILYLLHRQSLGGRKQAVYGLVLLALVSFIVFLPLFRYLLENPEMVTYRTMTRLSNLEQALPGSPILIFFQNLWKSLIMFFWNNGRIWVHSVSGRPALDVVSAAGFFLGIALVFIRYLRQRNWIDLVLLVSIPILMLPSILSLAFPDENPSLNRSGAAIIPVFIILGIGFDGLMQTLETHLKKPARNFLPWVLVLILLSWSAFQNYDLVFNQYQTVYEQSAWNTSEMGEIVRNFATTVGDIDHVWVVAYPHWVDTRLVGINAGYPLRDTAIAPEQIPDTAADRLTKMFLVKPDHQAAINILRQIFPQGVLDIYQSAVEGKDFLIFIVPGSNPINEALLDTE